MQMKLEVFQRGNTVKRVKIIFTTMLRQCLNNNRIFFLLTQEEKKNLFLAVSGIPCINQLKFDAIFK